MMRRAQRRLAHRVTCGRLSAANRQRLKAAQMRYNDQIGSYRGCVTIRQLRCLSAGFAEDHVAVAPCWYETGWEEHEVRVEQSVLSNVAGVGGIGFLVQDCRSKAWKRSDKKSCAAPQSLLFVAQPLQRMGGTPKGNYWPPT
jgi:hypothetical protein